MAGVLIALALALNVRAEPNYQTGTFLEIEKKVEYTPRSWLWDTVVTYSETVSYQLHIQLGNQTYVSEYVPLIQPTGPLPTAWKAHRPLELRVAKHNIFIRLPYDGEIETRIIRRVGPKLP